MENYKNAGLCTPMLFVPLPRCVFFSGKQNLPKIVTGNNVICSFSTKISPESL